MSCSPAGSFSLAPRILELGFAYLSTQSWIDRAEPLMKELSHTLHESCSAAILQGSEIVYVARMPAPHRIMSTTIAVGTRLPAVLHLARPHPARLPRRRRAPPAARRDAARRPHAAHHRRRSTAWSHRITADHAQGYSIVDEELEKGLRSLAVPIVTRSGVNVGAINLSAHSSRTSKSELRDRFLPQLRAVAQQISQSLP